MNDVEVITIGDGDLRLRLPRGDFTDTSVRGLVVSKRGSTAGEVQIRPWSTEHIARWHVEKGRFERVGRHVAWIVRRFGHAPHGSGLVQRAAAWRGIPLLDPPKSPVSINETAVDVRAIG